MSRRAQPRSLGIMRSIQAKLLTMLAVLSLPLLIVSLLQLDNYRSAVTEQSETIARLEAHNAALILDEWLQDHPAVVSADSPLLPALVSDLYARFRRNVQSGGGPRFVIRDTRGRIVSPPLGGDGASDKAIYPSSFEKAGGEQVWTDGKERSTSVAAAPTFGWTVAVGHPPIEETSSGRASVLLATVWALALSASILIAIWAVNRFTKPLRRLTDAAGVFGEGKFSERAVVETKDEVGVLAGTFNRMAESLQTRFDELQAQSHFINEVLDNLPLGVVVLDERLVVRRANHKFKNFVGRSDASLHGRGLYEAAAGLARLSEVVEDVRRSRRPFISYGLPLELVAAKQNETDEQRVETFWDIIIYPASNRATTERGDLLLILNEVSDRVRAEKLASMAFAAERARAAELSSVVNQMDDGVVIVDRRGRYRINPAAARILARAPGEFRDGVDALIDDLALRDLSGHLLDPAETPLRRALDQGTRTTGERFKISRHTTLSGSETPTAEERVLSISATPLVNEGDEREGMVAVFRDITEEVTQHEQLVGAYDRLREHDRLKSAFVANISHELRTPLNVIIGLCHLIMRDKRAPLAGEQTESVGRMERNARDLLRLVNNLLDYSRLEAGRSALHLEIVEVEEIVREIAEREVSEAEAKGVNFIIEIAPNMKRAYTDPQKLTQVVQNLVSNAVKFTKKGEVRVRVADAGENRWMLEVSDTGIGMTESEQAFVFDEFRQGDEKLTRRYGGAGLGLTITRKIIELLGGEILVESAPGEGSRFRVFWAYDPQQRTGTGSLLAPEVIEKRLTRAG